MRASRQFARFALVGAVGFGVDVGVLYLARSLGLDLYSARVISFVCAATITWLGNRLYTFASGERRDGPIGREWQAYLAAMALGAMLNYGTYSALITFLNPFRAHPWLAVAAGTGAGLLINFVNARRILYRPSERSGRTLRARRQR